MLRMAAERIEAAESALERNLLKEGVLFKISPEGQTTNNSITRLLP